MLTRRALFTGLTALSLTSFAALPASAQEADPFEWAFKQLSENERRNLQVELQMAGLYTANVDGKWGPSTRNAIVNTPNYLKNASGGTMTVQLETYGDVTNLLRDIAQGNLSYLLYREGSEG